MSNFWENSRKTSLQQSLRGTSHLWESRLVLRFFLFLSSSEGDGPYSISLEVLRRWSAGSSRGSSTLRTSHEEDNPSLPTMSGTSPSHSTPGAYSEKQNNDLDVVSKGKKAILLATTTGTDLNLAERICLLYISNKTQFLHFKLYL